MLSTADYEHWPIERGKKFVKTPLFGQFSEISRETEEEDVVILAIRLPTLNFAAALLLFRDLQLFFYADFFYLE